MIREAAGGSPATGLADPRDWEAQETPLTLREAQVLQLIAEGLTNREIGQRLGLAVKTVKNYSTSFFDSGGRRGDGAEHPDLPVDVEILPAATVDATLLNTITSRAGELRVVKSLTGTGAGSQGAIVLSIVCGDALNETFTIPARSSAGEYTRTFGDLPAGSECTVTETETGAATGVQVDGDGPVTVTVPAGAGVAAVLANEVTVTSAGGLAYTGGQWRLDVLLLGAGSVLLGAWFLVRRRRIVT